MEPVPVAPDTLSERWRHRAVYTLLELRTHTREHFLRAWRAWRADPAGERCAKLHFVAVMTDWQAADQTGVARQADVEPADPIHVRQTRNATAPDTDSCEQALDAAWPARVAGIHRLEFDNGQVVLTLAFATVSDALSSLWLRADEMHIDDSSIDMSDTNDGLSRKSAGRAKQPGPPGPPRALQHHTDASRIVAAVSPARVAADRHGVELAKGIARLAAQGSLLFVSSMPAIDPSLRHSGFEALDTDGTRRAGQDTHVSNAPTSASASDPLTRVFRFSPRWRVRRHEPPVPQIEPGHIARSSNGIADHDVMIIGAGLAGCALAERLAARGLRLVLIDAADAPASGASGNPAGVFHPVVATDDSLASRATRAGFLYALAYWRSLERRGFAFNWRDDGLIQVATSEDEEAAFRAAIDTLELPDDLVRYVSVVDADHRLGLRPSFGGLWFEHGGMVDPGSLCRAQLQAAQASTSLELLFNTRVETLTASTQGWQAVDSQGHIVAAAKAVVLANSNHASRLASLDHVPTRPIRGQLTWIEEPSLAALRLPLIGDGYLLPPIDGTGRQLTGASYELDDEDTTLREASQLENVARLQRLVPGSADALAQCEPSMPLAGRVALRCATSDRMPLIGQLADEQTARHRAASLSGAWPLDLPRKPGLFGAYGYGSRGLIWAALGAEIIASQIAGEPLPVPRSLADAFDPARFLMRALRQRELD